MLLSWRRWMQNCPHINCRPVYVIVSISDVVNSNAYLSIQMQVPMQAQEGGCGWAKWCRRMKRERRRRRREIENRIELERNRRQLHGMRTKCRLHGIGLAHSERHHLIREVRQLAFVQQVFFVFQYKTTEMEAWMKHLLFEFLNFGYNARCQNARRHQRGEEASSGVQVGGVSLANVAQISSGIPLRIIGVFGLFDRFYCWPAKWHPSVKNARTTAAARANVTYSWTGPANKKKKTTNIFVSTNLFDIGIKNSFSMHPDSGTRRRCWHRCA